MGDSKITLNISSSISEERNKQNVKAKTWSQQQGGEAEGERKSREEGRRRRGRQADRGGGGGGGRGRAKSAPSKFSSLFKNNPDIPSVPSVAVAPASEQVFSGHLFSELPLHPHLVACLEQRLRVRELTAVQRACIPPALNGRDLLVKAQTGSGKTLCYAVPLVQLLQAQEPRVERTDGPRALVIVPTRELAMQTYDTLRTILQPFQRLVAGVLMGGEQRNKEKARLRKGLNLVVGTPGRLLDHLQNTRCLIKTGIQWVVIDEADRLLDMGFEREVRQILQAVAGSGEGATGVQEGASEESEEGTRSLRQRQTLLLSATLSNNVESLAGLSLRDPLRIDIATSTAPVGSDTEEDLVTSARVARAAVFALPETLRHHVIIVPSKLRLVTLAAFILWKTKYTKRNKKMVVFLATNESVEFHARLLREALGCRKEGEGQKEEVEAVPIYKLFGDMPQKERSQVFRDFGATEAGVLLCTDVAARGLDLPLVRWIVQYDAPGSAADYIHRVGRTARLGAQGHALLFLTPAEVAYTEVLAKQQVSLAELKVDDILKTLLIEVHRSPQIYNSKTVHTAQEAATALQRRCEQLVAGDTPLKTQARKAFQSYVRAYATYSAEVKHVFQLRQLHLGHVAKSFALQDTPNNIGDVITKTAAQAGYKRKAAPRETKGTRAKQPRIHTVSEFSSGVTQRAKQQGGKPAQDAKSPQGAKSTQGGKLTQDGKLTQNSKAETEKETAVAQKLTFNPNKRYAQKLAAQRKPKRFKKRLKQAR